MSPNLVEKDIPEEAASRNRDAPCVGAVLKAPF